METKDKVKLKAKSRGLFINGKGRYERHIMLCLGANCCASHESQETWKYLGKRLSQLKKEGRHFYRTDAGCFAFCIGGPLAIVYPEGTWYHSVTPEVCERIIQEHLLNGNIVEEFAFAQTLHPLKSSLVQIAL